MQNKTHCLASGGAMLDTPVPIRTLKQGILKGEVSLYRWPPVWLVWNELYDNWQFLFLFTKQTNPNQSNRYSDTSPFSIPWLMLSNIGPE